ncbi:MAG: gamma-glutamyltransferase [Candidatus Eisenbacteria bacterium]|nr:gamma-glutamyltransferase [Candidatus Eisenbacteria bacterium]
MIIRPPTFSRRGMVVASEPLAAAAGLLMLERGGHAIDAVIAAGAVLAVIEPSASGLGGDAFLLVHEAGKAEPVALNGSGVAPAGLTADRFAGLAAVPIHGPASATVPGAVAAWWDAHARWGRLPWREVLAPALRLAQEGFAVSLKLARAIRLYRETLARDPGLASLYLAPDGRPLRAGETVTPLPLAGTLSRLAEGGRDSFYHDETANSLVLGVDAAGGRIGAADLAQHQSEWSTPYQLDINRRNELPLLLFEQPLPSQGLLLLVMQGLLDAAEEAAPGGDPWVRLHRQVEAKKVAFALRECCLTDPRFLPVAASELVAALCSEETLRSLSRLLLAEPLPVGLEVETVRASLPGSARRLLDRVGAGAGVPGRPGSDTTYLCATDADGNGVGMIQSIFHVWGSGFLEPRTGILLNNRAVGFSLDPRHVNCLLPGKRTLHTLNSYMIYRQGRPWLIAGTPGGDNQVQTNLQVVQHILHGSSTWPGPAPMTADHWSQARRLRVTERLPEAEALAAALEAPRWRHDSEGGGTAVRIEARMPAEIRKRLARMGHPVVRIGPWEGSGYVQAIFLSPETGCMIGATDPRGEGAALGI